MGAGRRRNGVSGEVHAGCPCKVHCDLCVVQQGDKRERESRGTKWQRGSREPVGTNCESQGSPVYVSATAVSCGSRRGRASFGRRAGTAGPVVLALSRVMPRLSSHNGHRNVTSECACGRCGRSRFQISQLNRVTSLPAAVVNTRRRRTAFSGHRIRASGFCVAASSDLSQSRVGSRAQTQTQRVTAAPKSKVRKGKRHGKRVR